MSTYVTNPPWVDKILNAHWDAIEQAVGAMSMPVPAPTVGKRQRFEEYGCGHYGCVLPCRTPGRVFKVSSDPSEAAFVAAAMQIGDWPDGIVRYYSVNVLNASSYRNRPVFIIVREEAQQVGELNRLIHGLAKRDQTALLAARVMRRLLCFKFFAGKARDVIQRAKDKVATLQAAAKLADWAEEQVPWDAMEECDTLSPRPMTPLAKWLKGPHAVAYAARAASITAQIMENENIGYLIGGALQFYWEHGLLLADVHAGNIGMIMGRPDYDDGLWGITDPGHMVPLDVRWLDARISEIAA